uniref:BRCT domain-containing protein n=1 Tax=Leersia perrieri TaxID=77586 RepID=A0A0D9VT49_9ORYZ
MASPISGSDDDDEHLFAGVRFLLVGFDPVSESQVSAELGGSRGGALGCLWGLMFGNFGGVAFSQYRSELVRRSGVDAGRVGDGCTHVIVCGGVYDDPACVAARAEGKKVVTELWVDDSLDRLVLADADRALYWPVRDSKGIPGSESLVVCLTGYHRNDRKDIMNMVSLMGAQFSKSFAPGLVTHLICYKFEGEKYEAAEKVNSKLNLNMNVKLVNHRWLEDCLKSWEILPVDDYRKSSWELEIMEAQVKDSEDEDVGQSSFRNKTVRSTLNPKGSVGTSANTVVNAPITSPTTVSGNIGMVLKKHPNIPGEIRKAEDAVNRIHDVAAQGTPKTPRLAMFANTDFSTPSQILFVLSDHREDAAVRDLNNPDQIQGNKLKDVGTRTLEVTSNASGTPSSSKTVVSANHSLHSLNKTNFVEDHGNTDVRKADLTPSREILPANELDSSRATCTLDAAAGRSIIDDKVTNHDVDLKSGSNGLLSNNKNTLKFIEKSVPPKQYSAKRLVPPQEAEGSMMRADSSNSTARKGDKIVAEVADIQVLKSGENIQDENVLSGAHTREKKCSISPAWFKVQNGDMGKETGTLNSPFASRFSDTSEQAIWSSVGTNPSEATNVDLGKQQSNSSKLRSRTTLKHDNPVDGSKFPEYSASETNAQPPLKQKELPTTCFSATVHDVKRCPDFTFRNKDGEYAQDSGNALNQDGLPLMCETENVHAKVRTSDISVYSSRNSKLIPVSGNDDTEMFDALDVDKNETAVASNCNPEKVVPDENVKANCLKDFSGTSKNVLRQTGYIKKVSSRRAMNASTKRPHSASKVVDGQISAVKAIVSESEPDKMIAHKHIGETAKDGPDSSNAADNRTNSSDKVLINGVRSSISRRLLNVHKKNGTQATSNLESSKTISEENTGTEINPKKFASIETTEEHQTNSPEVLPNTSVRNSFAKRSRVFDTKMTGESSVDRTETVAAKSLFDDFFPSENNDDHPKKLSSSASADGCGSLSKDAPSAKVRNAVAKRKIKAPEDKSDSKLRKIGGAIVSAAKAVVARRTEESSCNINDAATDQNSLKIDGVRDVSGLFSSDTSVIDRSENLNNPRLRCSKRNKSISLDHEKENRQDNGTVSSKSGKTSSTNANMVQNSENMFNESRSIKGNGPDTLIAPEPTCFILSGYRQQRKDYRSILRCLKARVCRDSHHWSYQATHFIAPDPLRRTEKFFAAAAAGKWILKSDYLISCNEVGKLLDEEPFEWFGTGLNDGETISFEAPRKWRALRQQTGHGAFYGMQIIVYGQLVIPSLDTLKRAVRSGDGTILATSPPYTRFLNSGVDFAVVSPAMPSADAWVQQFISHNIPCITADYLVEYVCKPGSPHDRHVLFNTNDLANESLKKLLQNQQVVTTDVVKPQEDDDHDLSCSACGSTDRGEVMLICGNEDGSTGCGVGMHIDCCDPPLEAVPEDDWFCTECEMPKATKKPAASRTASKSTRSKLTTQSKRR